MRTPTPFKASIADPEGFHTDADPTFYYDTNLDPNFISIKNLGGEIRCGLCCEGGGEC